MKISRNQFDCLVEQAIAALPPQFARWLNEVAIVVEDEPTPALLREMGMDAEDDDLLGLFSGHAITRQSVDDSGILPPQIMLFRGPLIDACDTSEDLADEIRVTLLHELGHYAGFDEDDLERLGYG